VTIFITLFNDDRLFFPQPSPARPGKAELSKVFSHRAFKGDCSYLAEAVHLLAASQQGDNALISGIQSQDVLNRQGGI